MSTVARNRLTRKDRGPGGKRTRSERTTNLPVDDDEQTQIEAELSSSGRKDVIPREGLFGAFMVRRQPSGETAVEPLGGGAEVAPTVKAELRERERHRLQREIGVVPASEDGHLRQQRAPGVTRVSLDAAAQQANRRVS